MSSGSIIFAGLLHVGRSPPVIKPQSAELGSKPPARSYFSPVKSALGEIDVIAEDLGVITPDVESLRDGFGFPGMRVLQFFFWWQSKKL
jgi:4-alpha-glucanotransferase